MKYLKDPTTGEDSPSLTCFIAGFTVCLMKLVFSGIDIGAFKLTEFSGADFAAAVGALGAIYAFRRRKPAPKD